MPETRSVPRNVYVVGLNGHSTKYESRLVSYEGGFLILREAGNLACANAIPMHRIHEVIEESVNPPSGDGT